MHFLNALRGNDRSGAPIGSTLDLDGDGRVSLLEADAYARIVSAGIDIPTRSSERWLRYAVRERDGRRVSIELPEDQAVIAGLRRRLGADAQPAAYFNGRVHAYDVVLLALIDIEFALADRVGVHYRKLATDMLERWPVINDPWHPLFAPLLARDRQKIRRFLNKSDDFKQCTAIDRSIDELALARDRVRVARAPVARLLRAMENLELAALLRGRGGPDWERYGKFLACERTFPP